LIIYTNPAETEWATRTQRKRRNIILGEVLFRSLYSK